MRLGAVKSMRKTRDSVATIAALKKAATELFVSEGYAGVNVEKIGRRARVTTGAIYHHFRDKRELFKAVAEDTMAQLVESIHLAVPREADPWTRLMAGIEAMLELSAVPEVKLAFHEAPAVLGRDEWRELETRHTAPVLSRNLEALVASGAIPAERMLLFGRLLRGMLVEAALAVADSADPKATRAELSGMIRTMIDAVVKGRS